MPSSDLRKGRNAGGMKNTRVCRTMVATIVTVVPTLGGRRRRKLRSVQYPQSAFWNKNNEHVAPCWKQEAKNLNGNTVAVLNKVFLIRVFVTWGREDLVSQLGNCVERTIADVKSVHVWSSKVQSTVAVLTFQLAHVWAASREVS